MSPLCAITPNDGLRLFQNLAVGVILPILSAVVAFRSKPWKRALPLAVVMFFFVMDVMGT
jgi:hypothetical protein